MGTIRNGGNGAFSGKAGSFIGSSWKNISYIKGLPKLSGKAATQKQLEQRKRFATVLAHLGPIKDILNLGFKGQAANRASGFNMGIQHALNNAVIGDYPDFSIDPAQIVVSRGTLQKPIVTLTAAETAKINIAWFVNLNLRNSFTDDTLFVLLYSEAYKLFLDYDAAATRGEGTVEISVPAEFSGGELGVYVFFQQRGQTRSSQSIYAGSITVL